MHLGHRGVLRRTLPLSAVLVVAATLPTATTTATAQAAGCTPQIDGPNDPNFAPSERSGTGTFNAEQWFLYDCIPASTPLAQDPEGAAGMSINRAWKDYGRGSARVTVAYMEGGINWRRPDSKDLRRKAYLNTGELPKPEHADGTPSDSYDLDSDGVVTVDDYAEDPRIHRPLLHADTAGGITPEDLIVAFSDAKDTDANGYVDDISGWNFHRDTNDPQTDQSVYGHANGEQRVLAAEADNDFMGAGMCPNCRLLSVKLGDEAIDRPDRVAEGIMFAVDSGADVIDVTSASLGQTSSMQRAVDYAYNHGTVIAWASNDFESADHTEGMRFAHVWPGNGVVSDQSNRMGASAPSDATATTFRSRSTLTSYGAHALFSVSSDDGSTSQATPGTAGVAALVSSAGQEAAIGGQINGPLDANEVFQVTRATASPITGAPCPLCFSGIDSAEFNIQYGYGRPNVYQAVKAVHDGEIPPTADISTPAWYQEKDPTRAKTVDVTAAVAAKRTPGDYRWELQYGLGPQPRDGDFTTIASGTTGAPATVSGKIDTSQIPASFWRGDYEAPTADRLSIERYDVTVRVQVRDAKDRLGEDRRVFDLRHDDSEVQQLHKDLGSSVESSPTLADLEGRGTLDTVVATSDGTVHVFRPDGKEAPGWPKRTSLARGLNPKHVPNYAGATSWRSKQVPTPREPISAPAAVGDLDGDGGLDVVVTGEDGHVYVWDARGKLRKGFPAATDRKYERQAVPVPDTPYVRNASTGSIAGAVLADLDGDGRLEIVMGAWDGHVYAWRTNGKLQPGWPVSTAVPAAAQKPNGTVTYARDAKVASTPTIVDVDGDSKPDVIVALTDTAFGEGGTPVDGFVMGYSSKGNDRKGGALLPHFPVNLPAAVQGYGTAQDFITEGVQTPVAYLDGGKPKLIANAGLYFSHVVDLQTGTIKQESPASIGADSAVNPASPLIHFSASPMVGKIGNGGSITSVQGASAAVDIAGGVVATPGLGIRVRSALTAWNPSTGANLSQFTRETQGLAFLSAPALADISGDGKPDIILAADSSAIHGFDGVTGAPVASWPKFAGWSLFTPAVGDLDGDGKVEVVTGTREGSLRAFRTPGKASGDDQAWHWHENDRNTGLYGQDTRPPAAVTGLRVRRGKFADILTFRVPGDDWNDGTAARLQVFKSSKAIIQSRLRKARRVAVSDKPEQAGTTMRVAIRRHGRRRLRYAVRAVDDAGNIGPLNVRDTKKKRTTKKKP